MGTWCLLGECLAENSTWQAYFLPHAGIHHGKLVCVCVGGRGAGQFWHICWAYWKPSVLRGKGTFSWVSRSTVSISLRETLVRQEVVSEQEQWLQRPSAHFFNLLLPLVPWSEFGAAQVQPLPAWVCLLVLEVREERERKKVPGGQREPAPWLWPPSLFLLHDGWLSANLWASGSWHVSRDWAD